MKERPLHCDVKLWQRLVQGLAIFTLCGYQVAAFADLHEEHYKDFLERRYACGRNALYALAALRGQPITVSGISECLGGSIGPQGVSLRQLRDAASGLGMPCAVRKLPFDELKSTSMPLVAHFDFGTSNTGAAGHFVVLLEHKDGLFWILDPTTGVVDERSDRSFQKCWTGYVLQPKSTLTRPGLNSVEGGLAVLTSAMLSMALYLVFAPIAPRRAARQPTAPLQNVSHS